MSKLLNNFDDVLKTTGFASLPEGTAGEHGELASLPEGTAGECRFVEGLTDPSLAGGIRN